MSDEPKRPETVPADAVWNGGENEWELGEKKDGKNVGEWKWWLAPKGHLVCQSMFDDAGNLVSFTRFHPNGEVSREGKTKNGKWTEDIYYASTEPTTEIFAYGPVKNAYKAVKRIGEIPVSFDYYDREGNHLNPELKPAEISAESDAPSAQEIAQLIKKSGGKSALAGELDESFMEVAVSFAPSEESGDIIESMIGEFWEWEADTFFVEGNLHLPHLDIDDPLAIVVVDGDLTVDGCLALYDDPLSVVIVNGNLTAGSIVVSGGLFVKGNVTVKESLIGDYNHGYADIGGSLTSNLFYPEEFFFTVAGESRFDFAFGNTWRLNENQNADVFNANEKTVREFFSLLHPDVYEQLDLTDDTYLDDILHDGTVWEYLDRYAFMSYIRTGKPIFKA